MRSIQERPMRITLIPILILTTGCGLFTDGGEAIANIEIDCSEKYEEWAEDIKEGEDDEDFEAVFEEIKADHIETSLDQMQAVKDMVTELEAMDKNEKKERFGELVELIDDPEADCEDARESYREELDDSKDACKAFFDWKEDQEDEWEKWDEEEDERDEKCEEREADDKSCFSPFTAKPHEAVKGPLKTYSKDDCGEN
jgi:hypothetical protein